MSCRRVSFPFLLGLFATVAVAAPSPEGCQGKMTIAPVMSQGHNQLRVSFENQGSRPLCILKIPSPALGGSVTWSIVGHDGKKAVYRGPRTKAHLDESLFEGLPSKSTHDELFELGSGAMMRDFGLHAGETYQVELAVDLKDFQTTVERTVKSCHDACFIPWHSNRLTDWKAGAR